MGASQSSREMRMPLVVGEIMGGDAGQAMRGVSTGIENEVCAVCIGPLAHHGQTHTVCGCGHVFHGLCLASALQAQSLCPLCRAEVPREECQRLAAALLADPSSARLAYELLVERKQDPESQERDEDIIDAINRATKTGDETKIPSLATFLGQGASKRTHSTEVRVAALEALRKLVPTFSQTWVGLPTVLQLLQGASLEDPEPEVRVAALHALREVAQRGDQDAIMCAKCVIEGTKAPDDVRLAAAGVIGKLGMRGSVDAARAAMAALVDPDDGVRSSGLTSLRAICGQGDCLEVVGKLAELSTSHPELEVRCGALEVLAEIEKEGGALAIAAASRACLRDKVVQVQIAALNALKKIWRIGDPEAVSMLAEIILSDNDSALRIEALEALPRVTMGPDAVAADAAVSALASSDDGVRTAAVSVLPRLSGRGDAAVLGKLVFYLQHQDTEVRRYSVEMLGALTSSDDLVTKAELVSLKDGKDPDFQLLAESALRRIGGPESAPPGNLTPMR